MECRDKCYDLCPFPIGRQCAGVFPERVRGFLVCHGHELRTIGTSADARSGSLPQAGVRKCQKKAGLSGPGGLILAVAHVLKGVCRMLLVEVVIAEELVVARYLVDVWGWGTVESRYEFRGLLE